MRQLVQQLRQRVGTEELRGTLQDLLACHFGTERGITKLRRRPSAYSSSFAIEELTIRLEDGTVLELMFKNLSPDAMLRNARRSRPEFLYDPEREIQNYETLLAGSRFGTATCFGAVVDPDAERYWLFLERVRGNLLSHVGDFEAWLAAARWLATLHNTFVSRAGTVMRRRATHLLNYDQDSYWLWMQRAQVFAQRRARARRGAASHDIDWLAARYDKIIERLMALPATIIHGEFFPSNVLVRDRVGELRVCPVDWEMAAVGPGLIDLAALTAGNWTEEQKKAMAMAYHARLKPSNGWLASPDQLLQALACCHLYLAVRMLGWSNHWSPPPEHAQNWLSEAVTLAERLEL